MSRIEKIMLGVVWGCAIAVVAFFLAFLAEANAQSTQVPVRGKYANVIEQAAATGAVTYFNKTGSGSTTTASAGETVFNLRMVNRSGSIFQVVTLHSAAAPNGVSIAILIPPSSSLEFNGIPIKGFECSTATGAAILTLWGWN